MAMTRVICSALVALWGISRGEAQASPLKCPPPAAQAGTSHTCSDKAAGTACWAYCDNGYDGLPAKYECRDPGAGAPAALAAVEKPVSCAASLRRLQGSCDASIGALEAPGVTNDCLGKMVCGAFCDTGYVADGNGFALLNCNSASGDFEFQQPGGALPTCIPEPCAFQMPDGLGVTSDCAGKGTNESCTAECSGAFDYGPGSGPETFVCQGSGDFAGTSPTCVARPCEVQAELSEYRTDTCVGKTGGQSCSVSCKAGYSGDPAMYSCNGTTGDFEPVALAVNCSPTECTSGAPPSADLNTTMLVGLTTGQSGDVTCANGYTGQAENWTCEVSGTVLGTVPTCAAMACDVASIGVLPGVEHTCAGKTFGGVCNMLCTDGYELAPGAQNEVWECVYNGTGVAFNGTVPNCTAKACDTSGFSSFMSHGCDGITVGQNCSYSCPVGTEAAAGTPAVQNFSCVAAGSDTLLHGSMPQCVPLTCSAANMSTPSTCDGIEVGQSCRAMCPKGYAGNATYDCAMDPSNTTATLQGEDLVCVGIPCENASLAVGVQHVHNCSGLVTNETCNLSCAPGYEGESVLVLCGDDRQFQPQGDFPACPPITSTSTVSMTSMSETSTTGTNTTHTTASMTSVTGTNTTHTTATMTGTTASMTNTTATTTTGTTVSSVTTASTVTNTSFSETTTSASTTSVSNTSFTTATFTNTTMTHTTGTSLTSLTTVTATTISTVTTIATVTGTSVTGTSVTIPAGFLPSVTAKVQMTVQDAANFITSTAAQTGFNTFLSTYLGLSVGDITSSFSLSSRRLRSLQAGNVEADVTVAIPDGSSTDQSTVEQQLNDMGDAQSADLEAALDAEGATGHSPQVTGATDVETGVVQATTPSPQPNAPGGGGDDEGGTAGAVIAIIVVLIILFIAAVAGGVAYCLYKRRGKGGNNNESNVERDQNADNSGEIPEDAMDEHGAGVEVRANKFQVNLPQNEDNAPSDAEGIRGR